MDLKSLSLPQRLLAGAGCVVVLAVIAAAALLFYLDRKAVKALARDAGSAPAGWSDSLRAAGRIPDLAGLVPTRSDTGDGAWVVYDTARAFTGRGTDHAYRALVGTDTANAADSIVWRELAADTGLDAWAAAARATRWEATERFLAMQPNRATANIMTLQLPRYSGARDAARALVIRGAMRLERRDRAGAQADFAAATGLGMQMARRDPSYIGFFAGRGALASGLNGWLRYATATRDTALAARVTRLRAWTLMRPGPWQGPLTITPDSAAALARDTSLALGMRTFALEQLLGAWFMRPRALVFGPPRSVLYTLDTFTTDPDADLAAMARIIAGTGHRLNLFGLPALMREGR